MDAFELENAESFMDEDLSNFDIVKRQDYFELTNYQLDLKIQQRLIDMLSKEEIEVDLDFHFELSEKHEEAKIGFKINDNYFEAKNGFMELIFDNLQKQFDGKYRFKNCYGCLYGDYSVYGQGFMGPVLCFKNQKEAYLRVQNKGEYMDLDPQESTQQEIFCCDEYEIRDKSVGYRGTVI
ncbi:hypothetical protein SAMN05660477_00259 [Soonwooa buanensis]|uniref:Uncharacterized protein n=1 Tax=Soonwooa buanensis TaxID=619805 RepID=A0A1T5CQX0_9FLAO|nr:hypothetical protein SAMN05660477_00259 [Soonwooa buanensis]